MSKAVLNEADRVVVPASLAGAENIQGVVTGVITDLGLETRYRLQWVSTEAFENGVLGLRNGKIGENDLIAAQPGPMVTAELANRNADNIARQACDRVRFELQREYAAKLRKLSRKRTRK